MPIEAQLAIDAQRFRLTVEQIQDLRKKATEAKQLAYCPYSKFRVGAAFLTPSGAVITGVNVENASYPVGICAERCAVSRAISQGYRKFTAVAVSTDISPPASPCGMCRQFIREFCSPEVPIFMTGSGQKSSEDEYAVMQLGELLPMSFGPEKLGVGSDES